MPFGIVETEAYLFLAILCRIGSTIMVLPGFGDLMVPAHVRLVFALFLSALLVPVVGPAYPPMPAEFGPLLSLILGEVLIGLALGLIVRMFLMALQVAGTVIASQTGLAFAQNFDPTIGLQGALLSSFLTMLGITLVFQTDLHHLMLSGLVDAYSVLTPGAPLPIADLSDLATRTFAAVFRLGVQLSAPFIIFSLVFYAAAGAIARLLPQIQIFFLMVPLNILAGFALLMLVLGALMLLFLDQYGEALRGDLL